MKARAQRHRGRPALELLEEAFVLLRRTPLEIYLAYYLGAVPFCIGMLFFVADMSRSAFAGEHAAGASLLMALLYLWMKCWHAFAARQWRGLLGGEAAEPWTAPGVLRFIAAQAALHSWGLVIRPLAYLATLPAVWVAAFYQNASALGALPGSDPRPLGARAAAQARLWPGQAHALFGLFSVFVFFVWLNIALMLGALPALVKMLTGIETMASRSLNNWFLNGTFVPVTLALTFLCVDPIWKVLFVLRCFYGESLQSGADLQARLKSFRPAPALAALLLALLTVPALGEMKNTPPAADARAAAPAQVDEQIERVLQRREYAWRLPRRPEAAEPESNEEPWWVRPFRAVGRWGRSVWKAIENWFERATNSRASNGSGGGFPPIKGILYVLLGALAVALAWTGFRAWQNRRRGVTEAQPVAATPDLHSEDLVADQLPEDGWLRLMREMTAKGEWRLALRAAYLGGLAHLGKRDLLAIARHKTNYDYWRELSRRARSREELLAAFGENLRVFERAWYGSAGVTAAEVSQFTANLERNRAC